MFVSDVSKYICSICTDVARNPVDQDCIHYHCQECLNEWCRQGKRQCPACTVPIDYNAHISKGVRAQINHLEVRCLEDGCTWTGVLSKLDAHAVDCSTPCPFDCERGSIPRRKMAEHLQVCDRQPIKCSICEEHFERSRIASHQDNTYRCVAFRSCLEGCTVVENQTSIKTYTSKQSNGISTDARLARLIKSLPGGAPMPLLASGGGEGHQAVCPRSLEPCEICHVDFERRYMQDHMETSLYEHVACMFQQMKQQQCQHEELMQDMLGFAQANTIENDSERDEELHLQTLSLLIKHRQALPEDMCNRAAGRGHFKVLRLAMVQASFLKNLVPEIENLQIENWVPKTREFSTFL